ncbi:hypothetical protein F8M41_008904 [Gigaspora margarita]|uniref:Uncharacterized protein n=1 Tax=Gigaspora margarita TaxID=4874 RepID=A0A8H3X4D0_GIGMA|nr:hypothetical protein F8M41_008904 [Gigaspora margarita]
MDQIKIVERKELVNKKFSEVLKNLKEIDSNYTTKPIEKSFNWNEIASGIKDIEGECRKSWRYWSDEFNQNRECLSMCIWASKDNAIEASKKPQHTAAKKLANMSNYEFYVLEKYVLKKKMNETEIKIIQIIQNASI